ncbi:MAG TPA: flagellar biosynthetic protein FliR [Burkholderiaceae bacterium]|nr:flagellar biosynthetic protein FliR [Burkholderiaceae bacterium]
MITVSEAQLTAWLSLWLWPFLRVLALCSSAPVLSHRSVPARLRIGLSLAVSVLIAGLVPSPPPVPLMSAQAGAIAMQQVLIGLTVGFAARLVFAAFELAGEIIGLQMGFGFAGYFDPQSNSSGTSISSFLGATGTLLFIALGGHLLLLLAVVSSFDAFPISDMPFDFLARANPLQWGTLLFRTALLVALPFVALLLFVNLALGVISRVAPQFNITAVGFSATILVGLTGLAAGLPMLEQPMNDALMQVLSAFQA